MGGRPAPGSCGPTRPRSGSALDAFERALGVRPLLVRTGGTLPIMPALADKGIATILTGFGLPGVLSVRSAGTLVVLQRWGSRGCG